MSQNIRHDIITQSLCFSTLCTIIFIAALAASWLNFIEVILGAKMAVVAMGAFLVYSLNDKFKIVDKLKK